jgi:hypothetical protein
LTDQKAHVKSCSIPILGCAIVGAAAGLSFLFPWSTIPYWAVDFTVYYAAASAMSHGQNPYILANLTQHVPPSAINPVLTYSYPPLLALLIVPLTAVPLEMASHLWLTINLLAPGVSAGMVLWAAGWKPKPIIVAALLLGAIFFLPCLYTYISGQASLWSLLWASLGLFLFSRKYHAPAGASWALAWAKPHPLPLLPIDLFFKNRRGLAVFIVIMLVSLGLAAPWLPGWPQAVIDIFKANTNEQEILYQATALGALSYLGMIGLAVRVAAGIAAVGTLIALARCKVNWKTFAIAQFSLGLLVAPYIGRSDVAIALIPMLLIISDRRANARPAVLLVVLAWCMPLVCIVLRLLLGVDWLLLPLVWGGLTQWTLAAASAWYVKAAISQLNFDITVSNL